MIRQAHTYLAGAVSGTVLIAIAVAIFVMLVSVQAAKDWPLADLVGGDDGASGAEVSAAQPGGGGCDGHSFRGPDGGHDDGDGIGARRRRARR